MIENLEIGKRKEENLNIYFRTGHCFVEEEAGRIN